jgi:hypothetical protein
MLDDLITDMLAFKNSENEARFTGDLEGVDYWRFAHDAAHNDLNALVSVTDKIRLAFRAA